MQQEYATAQKQNSLELHGTQVTLESIDLFWIAEKESGLSKHNLRRSKGYVLALYEWLPADKILSRERLIQWRASLRQNGYSEATVLNYVKGINRYLDYLGCSEIRFDRRHPKDISNRVFGDLTAIAPTPDRYRKDVIWECKCSCGKTVFVAATRLLTGNTQSCGCRNVQLLRDSNQYIEHTSLRQSLEERVESTRAQSGYTGVTRKRDKWSASITYKKKCYYLGCYSKLEDAVKARARAKQLVMEDAEKLLQIYHEREKHPQKSEGAAKNTPNETSALDTILYKSDI